MKNVTTKIWGIAVLATVSIYILSSCSSIPKNAKAVKPFNSDKYLGAWYEIARLDFRFEKDLNNTSANYSMNSDGTIKVVNKGFNYIKDEWKEVTGKAKFVGDKEEAKLKVSFFGPFYSGYNVIAIDENYQYALVAGKNLSYLWILSRTTNLPKDVKDNYLKIAENIGYDTSKLVWVNHDK